MTDIIIRPYQNGDWENVWKVLKPTFRAGATYPVSPDISEVESRAYWLDREKRTYLALDKNGDVGGTYYIRPNQARLGAHICNCGYVVSSAYRGQGLGALMCRHSQDEARNFGYLGMQYNLVVSSNEGAIRLWKREGFNILGTVPNGFRHKELGLIDAYIMFKTL